MQRVNLLNALLVVLISSSSFIPASLGNYLNYSQPQIFVMNGHMVIQAADGKNLALTTSKSGKLYLNGEDITGVLRDANRISDTLESFKANIGDLNSKLNVAVSGVDSLYSRVTLMEKGGRNTSIDAFARQPANYPRLNRRLIFIQRKLRALTALLTQNECVDNPCQNGGQCLDMFNGYLCHCPDNWEGPRCDKDVNECARFANTDLGCQNGATCINRVGTYECICASGWLGLHCTRKSADCTTASNMELCGHGQCISHTGLGYTCICDQGWTTEDRGILCTKDVNECNSNRPPCSTNPPVSCFNLPGTFSCGSCPIGYSGNGYYCNDIDECEIRNGDCSVNPMVQCINTPGSRMCGLCPPGYQGNGVTCTYQGNVCSVNNGGCSPLATCQHNPRISASFIECTCPSGFVGSGYGPLGCSATAQIIGTPGPCVPNPCVHGTCTLSNNATTPGGFQCACVARFTGLRCDTLRDLCENKPCKNGGTCATVGGVFYRCRCPSGFTGRFCQIPGQTCSGTLRGESGQLSYPPENSTAFGFVRHSCGWVVITNSMKVLTIKFDKFVFTRPCLNNFLQIHDGRNSASAIIGRFCNGKPPNATLVSTVNNMYFWYRGDASSDNDGFSLTWNSTDPVCGETISAVTHGTIKSPGSPQNYPENRDCYWKITAPLGKRLEFHFFSLLIGSNSDCTHDYLEFYQGLVTTDAKFARYCNSSHPEPLVSPGPEVAIHFHSDATENYAGFQISYSVISGIPGCGGIYTRDQGSIVAPVVATNYPPNELCEFKIQLRTESKVKFVFFEFALENSQDCQTDYLAIHSGNSIDSPLVGKFCGPHLPTPLSAVGSEFLIVYKTDWAAIDRSFKLKYKVVCGGKYTSSSGGIEYSEPNYENVFEHHECVYEIIEPPGTIISLTVNKFLTSTTSVSTDCILEYLEIRDGDNANSTLIGQFCNKYPTLITSTQNIMWIKLVVRSGSSFAANYSTTDIGCGGILKSRVGTVQSPEHLEAYAHNLNCTWLMVAPTGSVIQLTWVTFNVEVSANCAYDRVEVYDNNTAPGMGGTMGTFCGVKVPPTLMSSSNMMTIKFVTDTSVNMGGFLATYVFMKESSVCGGNFFTSAGLITSPNYPNRYPPHKTCTWVISVAPGQQILLNVTKFDIESYSNCRYDYLEIRNGGTSSAPFIGKYCGKIIPKTIPTHANMVYLQFVSDMTNNGPGFVIRWESTTTGCGGALTSPVGSIISPHYPEPYSRNTECFWKISTSAGSVVQVVFADIELEPHVTCFLDYVELFDGFDATAKSMGKYCSSAKPIVVKSTNNHLTVKFRSDVSYQGRGFNLQYSTECHNKVSGFRGVIESPNFPNGYPQDLDCLWEIGVPEGNAINITFSHFELERTNMVAVNGCVYDYVQIKYQDVEADEIVNYGTYCGDIYPPDISIKSNLTQIHFVSDNLMKGSGFRLEWVIVGCGGVLTHPNGTLQTPNYPSGYPRSTICDWVIQVNYGTSIELTFSEIMMEMDSFCNYDSIKIYNGPDDTYPLITTFCHKTTDPFVITSTGNNMFVRFKSDSSYQGRGFNASYTTVPTKCGGKLSAPSASFSSPNYPKNFDKNSTCAWLIEITQNNRIELTFNDMDLISTKDCEKYYIQVHDGPTNAYPSLAKLCGNTTPNRTFFSTYNHMYLEMVSHDLITSKGFLASYATACGARIETQTSGLIEFSPQLATVSNLANCTWTIISQRPDEHVSLTITHMELNLCEMIEYEDYGLKVYNGDDNQAPILGQFCGNTIPPQLTSTGSMLHIELNNTYLLFTASYSVYQSACGGTLESMNGQFASPGYPKPYPVDIQCEWIVKVAPGNRITLSFKEFKVVSSSSCNDDYLEMRLGSNTGKLIGVYCGQDVPASATHNESVWLMFKSVPAEVGDEAKTDTGFLAEYNLVHGGDLYGIGGEIASPLYPRFTTQADTYFWRITVANGHAVSLTFTDIYIEMISPDECYLSNIQIYDGYDTDSTLMRTFCGMEIPEAITTTSNVMYIKADLSIVRHGMRFSAKWEQVPIVKTLAVKQKDNVTGCGEDGIIDMTVLKNYTISSPGYPTGYANSLDCEWTFETTAGNHLELSFETVDIENLRTCITDTITISNRVGAVWSPVSVVCLTNATEENVSTGDGMKIAFHTDGYGNKTGFTGTVYLRCGGQLAGPNGVIKLDNETFYERGGHQDTCEWNVTVRSGRTIKVEFQTFKLGSNSENLCQNYVLLKNGIYSDSPILGNGKYCGTDKPEELVTTGNNLFVKAKMAPKLAGFIMKYSEVSSTCGGTYRLSKESPTVEINSPNYPNIPAPHTECKWVVSAPPGESLQIEFEERFDLADSEDCKTEAVELRNGGSKMSPLIGRYCGQETPSSAVTADNMIYIDFFTDSDDPKNGFKAKIKIATCGGVIRNKMGTLQSPFFNEKRSYGTPMNCSWKIVGPRDHFMNLQFTIIDLRQFGLATNCTKDYVLVKEYIKMNNTVFENVLGKFCKSKLPENITTSGNEVIVEYSCESYSKFYKGFSLQYNSSQEVCGGEVSTSAGLITSPGYPVINHNQRHCEWIIRVPKGRRITFNIEDFDMDEAFNFYGQGAAFFNGEEYKSTIAVLKAGDKTKVLRSSDNVVTMFFWSTHASNHRGFKVSYTSDEPTACPGDFNKQEGLITQPRENMTSYACTWIREKPNGHNETVSISVVIANSSTTTRGNCKYTLNSISITDNKDTTIAQVCASSKPTIIRSPFPITKISASAYGTSFNEFRDFDIHYKAHSCGGIVSALEGTIANPSSTSAECAWLIKLPEDQTIKVTVDTFDLGDDCDLAYFIIYNGDSPSSPKIGRFCNGNKPEPFQSQGNSLWLEYHSATGSKVTKGFKLRYETVPLGCGGIYYDNTMIIQSPNYPKDYTNNAECVWEIHVANGHHIGLQFVDRFHLEQSEECKKDFVEIWDLSLVGNTTNKWVSLGKVCGREYPKIFNSTGNRMKVMFRSDDRGTGSGFKAKWLMNCGGTFLATEKVQYITSPGYPDDYPNDLQCIYTIKPIRQTYMEVIFEDFELEKNTADCNYDVVRIEQVNYINRFRRSQDRIHIFRTPAIKYCGTNKPQPMRTNQEVVLNFTTDSWIAKKGFMLSYALDVCGGVVDVPSVISTNIKPKLLAPPPSYLYIQSTSCTWNITAPVNQVIVARFVYFQIDYITSCAFGALTVYQSFDQTDANRLARLCGNLTDNLPTITSPGNKMSITITASLSNVKGFIASVYFMPGPLANCGGTIKLTHGTTHNLATPRLNETLDCVWQFIAPEDHSVRLEFTKGTIRCPSNYTVHGTNCTCNLYQVRDGAGPFAELISEFCDESEHGVFLTSGRYAWFRMFSTDMPNVGKPFTMKISSIPSLCGPSVLAVKNETQYLTSPNYPESYPENIKCVYMLQIPDANNHIYLNFIEFNLTDANTDDDLAENTCNNDRIQISDGKSAKYISDGLGPGTIFSGSSLYPLIQIHFRALPLGTHLFCGQSTLEHHYYSGGDRLALTFISGSNAVKGKGFKMQYRVSYCPPDFTTVQGRILTDRTSGDCRFKITAPKNSTISLYFQQFFLYDFQNCENVGFEVMDTNATKPLSKSCGYRLPDPIFSKSNEIEIHSWNKRSNYLGHYDVVFTTTDQGRGCGGKIYNYAGKFTSPMYPENYRQMRTCQWDVTIPAGLQLAFKFAEFDVQGPCASDFVTVTTYEGTTPNTRKFCKNETPAPLMSDRRITVKHTTSVNNAGTGWVAQFIGVTSDTSLKNW